MVLFPNIKLKLKPKPLDPDLQPSQDLLDLLRTTDYWKDLEQTMDGQVVHRLYPGGQIQFQWNTKHECPWCHVYHTPRYNLWDKKPFAILPISAWTTPTNVIGFYCHNKFIFLKVVRSHDFPSNKSLL